MSLTLWGDDPISLRRAASSSPAHAAGLELDRDPLARSAGGTPPLVLGFDA